MLHEPSASSAPDYAVKEKTRLGVWMFLAYAVVYAGFVAINVLKPVLMETRIVFGLNLAVFYGFGLIVLALILALVYNHACRAHEKSGAAAAAGKEAE
jgi:uncharacterized membrane protein (DUF485 family)